MIKSSVRSIDLREACFTAADFGRTGGGGFGGSD